MEPKTGIIVIYAVIYIFVFMFGSIIGSFLGVVIERTQNGESFIKGRSHCCSCGHTLFLPDLIPVFSYLFLRGKCRFCKAKISPRCLALELLAGFGALLAYFSEGFSILSLLDFALMCGLIVITYIDIDTMEIPNGAVIFLLIIALFLTFLTPETNIISHVIGFFCISVPLLLFSLAIPGSFGGGDVKLMAACGLALGWKNSLLAFFIALLLGGTYAALLLIMKKIGRKDHFAFGPFLAAGVVISLLFGSSIISWYLGLFS